MGQRSILGYHSPCRQAVPAVVVAFAAQRGLTVAPVEAPAVLEIVNRTYPRLIVIAGAECEESRALCRALKSDPFTAVVPVVLFAPGERGPASAALEVGFDEVLTGGMDEREQWLRLEMTVRRAERDVSVHPTTRLPGTPQIERDIGERIRGGELFAVCYADLDHFKEFNDRYGYNEGDRIIGLLSRILRDLVRGYAPSGFVGHIGGDDFIFNVPVEQMPICCEEILALFDELIPYQYTDEDRQAGYFLGRDRRGNILWVPLMTLSIGVVTNRNRRFTHTARVSELATEMKSFAKTLTGSVYAVDRRSDARDPNTATDFTAGGNLRLEP